MPYIGNIPADKFLTLAKQSFSTSATTSYTLDSAVSSTQDIALFINSVRQSPVDAYTVSGTALTLTSATAGTDEMYCVFLAKTVGTVSPSVNSITNAMMTDDSVGVAELSATGTASSSVFLRGDNAWSTPTDNGKIGQVLSTTKTDTFTVNSRSYSAITGLSVSITPSATSSKILVIVSLQGVSSNNGDAVILRDSTQIAVGDTAGSRTSSSFGEFYNGAGSVFRSNSASILDSPSSTSAITYSVSCLTYTSSVFYVNRSATDTDSSPYSRSASTITVMEVLA